MKHTIFLSSDSNVKKFVFESGGGTKEPIAVEAVLYKYGSYTERTVICCSTQCGCPVGCSFCGTGKFFVRNLTAEEIVDQVHIIMQEVDCKPSEIKKFQIMFMSMGEPMMNYEELEKAIYVLFNYYPGAQLLISTSAPVGMIHYLPRLITLSKTIPNVGLQFSVHEATDEARQKLIPTRTSTLAQISCLGATWAAYTGRRPYFNYCVHEGNNSYTDAVRLSQYFNPDVWECTLSVICQKDESMKSSIDRQLSIIRDFEGYMVWQGFSIRVFNPAGQDDIGGGCGQLWYFQKWLKNRT